MSGTTWIILGFLSAFIGLFSLFAIPYGMKLNSNEEKLKIEKYVIDNLTRFENISNNFRALAQIKSEYYKYHLGYDDEKFIAKIRSNNRYRDSLTGSLQRLLGLRDELISYNFDSIFFDLINNNLALFYNSENDLNQFKSEKTEDLIYFVEKLVSFVNSTETKLIIERNDILSSILNNSSINIETNQMLLTFFKNKLSVLSEFKRIISNIPVSLNNEQFVERLNSDSVFRENLTQRFGKLFSHRVNAKYLFYIDQELINLIDNDLSLLYLFSTGMNKPYFKENKTCEFVTFTEKIISLIHTLENESQNNLKELYKQHKHIN